MQKQNEAKPKTNKKAQKISAPVPVVNTKTLRERKTQERKERNMRRQAKLHALAEMRAILARNNARAERMQEQVNNAFAMRDFAQVIARMSDAEFLYTFEASLPVALHKSEA